MDGKARPPVRLSEELREIEAFLDPIAEHEAVAVRVDGFVGELSVDPESDEEGRDRGVELVRRLGAEGLLAHATEATSAGLRAACLVREGLAAASPLADAMFALQGLGSAPLALAGGPELAGRWLPRIASGEAVAAFAMTEAEAGSDVAALGTTATPIAGGYRLEGRKLFISNAGIADVYLVFARLAGTTGRDGITCFLVPAEARGFRFVAAQRLSSPHPLGEIAFEGCEVPRENRVGGEGEGYRIGLDALDRLRATVAAAACGMAQRALAEAKAHATRRHQFGRPLAGFQLVQAKIARMATDLSAARLLTYRAALAADRGEEELSRRSAMAKLFATEAAQRVVDEAVQIVGGGGVLASHPVDRLYRAVRALRIYEGTSEIQQLVIARHELGRGRRRS